MADAAIVIDTSDQDEPELTGDGAITVPLSDGSVVIDLRPPQAETSQDFDRNLAEDMDTNVLSTLAESIIEGIDADLSSRKEWEQTRERGIDLLGLKLEGPRSDFSNSSAPLEGMSSTRDPALLEALLRFQANAIGELLPAEGPVKVKIVGGTTEELDDLGDALAQDLNHYLTDIATEYYPDSKRSLFWTGFGGSDFKKVYHCPIRRRPISERVDADNLIVSNAATDLWNAARVTHRITMRQSVMRRMQFLGAYRQVELGQPTSRPSSIQEKKDRTEGIQQPQDRPEDQPYTLYECYCECDLDEYAPADFKGKSIPLPYRVTLDKDSRQILEVRRNWKENDSACLPRKCFVKYPFIEGLGFYGIGLVHVLGNATTALTALLREMIDAGMFANFPGFIYLRSTGKQMSNEFRVPPAGGVGVDAPNNDVTKVVMPLPYKDITPGLMNLYNGLTEKAQRLGGTADMPIGEGKQDAPVGTTLALIEQSTKVESAIHKGLHKAQAEEFQLLKERFKEDPEALWRNNPNCRGQWDEQKFLAALDQCELVPVADPNIPSHMHRMALAIGIKQMADADPKRYNQNEVDKYVLKMFHVNDADKFFNPPVPAGAMPPSPEQMVGQAKLADAATNRAKLSLKAQEQQQDAASTAAELEAKQKIANTNLAKEMIIHGDQHGLALKQHALDVTQAAHDATMDLSNAQQLPGG